MEPTPEKATGGKSTVIAMAVFVPIAIAFFLLIGVLAVAGSYLLTIHTIDVQHATALHLAAQQAAEASKLAKTQQLALCQQLVGLDDARNGIKFSAPTKTGTAELYVLRLSAAIHSLVSHLGCE
jgi:hypothetical protein